MITLVPAGYCEFCYIADAQMTVSQKHPTIEDGSRNWRTVCGPPSRHKQPTMPWRLHERLDQMADTMQTMMTPIVSPRPITKRRRQYAGKCNNVVDDVESAGLPSSMSECSSSSFVSVSSPGVLVMVRFVWFFVRLLLICSLICTTAFLIVWLYHTVVVYR